MEIKFGDLAVRLDIEWKEPALFSGGYVSFKENRFRRIIEALNSRGDVIAVIRVQPNSHFVRELLTRNYMVLKEKLRYDWVRNYGIRHLVIFQGGFWIEIWADSYMFVDDGIEYHNVVEDGKLIPQKVIPREQALVVVDVRHGIPIYGSVFLGVKNEGEDSVEEGD